MKGDLKNIYNDIIKEYMEGSLTDSDKEQFAEFIKEYPNAMDILEEEKAFKNFMVEAQLHNNKAELAEFMNTQNKGGAKWLYFTIPIVLLIIGGVYFFLPSDNDTVEIAEYDQEVTVSGNEIVKPIEDNKEIVENAEQDKYLELDIISATSSKKPSTKHKNKKEKALESSTIENNAKETSLEGEVLTPSAEENQSDIKDKAPIALIEKDTCELFVPQQRINIENVALGNEYGSINIESEQGAVEYSLEKEYGYEIDPRFEVEKGDYTIFAKDENGCITQIKSVTISQNLCVKDYPLSFSVSNEETWKVPVDLGLEYSVVILDKYHNQVFVSNSQNNTEYIWDGKNTHGENVALGFYKVFIQYENGEKCEYGVTVFD